MIYILLLIVLFVIQLAYFRAANRFNIVDKPNARSSHDISTLRGGGILFYIGILFYFLFDGFQYPWFFLGLTLIAIISFVDDIRPQPAKLRLFIHFTALILMFNQLDLYYLPWYYTLMIWVVFTFILNAYNFMDGINGITGGYSLVVAGAFWYINEYQTTFVDKDLIYSFIAALIVFNFFNFRPVAKCFAGDVGAISAAFILSFLLGLLIIKTGDFSYIVLLAVYGVDTVFTILYRLILKENIFKAHRMHVYQLMANELKISHILVTVLYCLIQALIIAGLILVDHRYFYAFCVILVLSVFYVRFMRKYFHLHQPN